MDMFRVCNVLSSHR